jgi:hypothetical protein
MGVSDRTSLPIKDSIPGIYFVDVKLQGPTGTHRYHLVLTVG